MHTKGEWAGQPFELALWQKERIIRPLFGWKRRADGLRRYRVVYVEVPKKNGKSQLAAGVALLLLFADGEPGAEIYSAAKDREQAGIVFKPASAMVRQSPQLLKRSEVWKKTIDVPSTGSFYQVLSADVPSKHGLNVHGLVFDEFHVQDNREMWDTLSSGIAARRQPVIFITTTAGFDKKTVCGQMHDKALAIAAGTVRDDTFLPVVYGITEPKEGEKGQDWESEKTWSEVNPNFGVSVKTDYLRAKYQDAKESPAVENAFRRLHLNEWTQQAVRWINQKKWAACAGPVDYQQLAAKLKGRSCYGGLDLSTVTDLSAFVLVFDSIIKQRDKGYPTEQEAETDLDLPKIPGWEYGDPLPAYDVLAWFWVPEEGIRIRSKRDKVGYDVWRDEGALIATPGDAVDQGAIRKKIQDLGAEYSIMEIGADPYQAHKLLTELEEEDGFVVARMGQGFGKMSAPTKEIDTLYRRRQLRHGGQPVLSWCADNVTLDKDAYDNWKPSKKRSRERIDGMVALVMAMSRAILSVGKIEDVRLETLG